MFPLFDFAVQGAGWTRFTWLVGVEPITWDASYLHDSLQDLAHLALHL